jgi:predicted MFS family arabinose efflux permease
MHGRSRNVILLSISQALGTAGVAAVVLLGGIIGAQIAPSPALATLPASIMVIGVALATIPAALLTRRIGRRRGFIAAAALAGMAALLATYAVAASSFGLFCVATLLIGVNGAFVQQYRFAAAESVPASESSRAVSIVLVGGIVAGYLGPEVARRTRDMIPAVPYAGAFLSLALLYAAVMILLLFLKDGVVQQAAEATDSRPFRAIMSQPVYLVAILSGVVAYGVMSFIMTATPLHLHHIEGYDLDATARVIQSHIMAMFVPSLFAGILIERLGLVRVMLAGVLALFACVVLALISRALVHYWGALVLLGIGWNFLFVGGTVLLTRSYQPAERFKSQAVNDFAIFGTQALASLSAGSVLYAANWDTLNLLTLPLLALTFGAILSLRQVIAPLPRGV